MTLAAWLTPCPNAFAGGGPENVLLVVNSASPGSLEVGNHYARLRDIPPTNVLHLDYRGPKENVRAEAFRERILTPILRAIDGRGLSLQIDAIAYSTDFPWRVDFTGEYPEGVKLPKQMRPIASLTGATYLFGFVRAKSPGLVGPQSNWYLAPTIAGEPGTPTRSANSNRCRRLGPSPSRAFRSRYAWRSNGARGATPRDGQRYLLATMLGVTTGRGLTTPEVIDSLRRAVIADTSPPTGTFYFAQNQGVRSATRHNCYAEAVQLLRAAGAEAVVSKGVLPPRGARVAGMMLGAARLPLDTTRLAIDRGALCEHLTSLGGVLRKNASQTPLTDLIRAGAAGASGTVVEPYAIQAKFPLPTLHVHYRRGCSLAESFYQSVASPYQLLIVGDPLCQPWAQRPTLSAPGLPNADRSSDAEATPITTESAAIEPAVGDLSRLGFAQLGLPAEQESTDEAKAPATEAATDRADSTANASPVDEPSLTVAPQVRSDSPGVCYWELFVDGRLRMRLPSDRSASIPHREIGPGWHDLRLVGVGPPPLECQARLNGELTLDQPDAAEAETSAGGPSRVALTAEPVADGIRVSVTASGADRLVIRHDADPVADLEGSKGSVTLARRRVGAGPVRLQAIAEPGGVRSPTVWVETAR